MRQLALKMTGAVGRAAPTCLLAVATASALGASAVIAARHVRRHPLAIAAAPLARTVVAGHRVSYAISVRRGLVMRRLSLRVSRLPRSASVQFRFTRRSPRRATLMLATTSRTPPGHYHLRLRASHGALRLSLVLELTVSAPGPATVGISGTVSGLEPGAPQPIDLSLVNPNSKPVEIGEIDVTAQGVGSPAATSAPPCTLSDFSVQQFAGAYPLTVPAKSTLTLSELGVPAGEQPQVTLVDRPVDQDGCQGATLNLSYHARGSMR